jgi:hypothetical protein
MREERIELSQRERERLKVLHEMQRGHLRQREAAGRLPLGVLRPASGPKGSSARGRCGGCCGG